MSASDYALTKVETPSAWRAYHAIRRDVLFEARGQCGYDPEHPDESKPENLPLLLTRNGVSLGTVRLDRRAKGVAIVRLVAIRTEHQRSGHGSVLLQILEHIARELAIGELHVHAAADAVGFYLKQGYIRERFDPDNRGSGIQLSKRIQPLR